jgi:hypothetical protein
MPGSLRANDFSIARWRARSGAATAALYDGENRPFVILGAIERWRGRSRGAISASCDGEIAPA